jgi:ATP-dependent Clp protease ATP-binding subunit ClpA
MSTSERKRAEAAVQGIGADIAAKLSAKIAGQNKAIETIVPYFETWAAGLSAENRPAGVFLLLGPTGTGKTRTVEAIAETLHGDAKHLLRIDCGEYQMEHEVAKLIGAPPGYLGHRETQPALSQAKLNAAATERCDLSIVLFDEIEKAAPSFTRLLLGILDRATLRLGDNNVVNFEKSVIFMTSNLGANGISREMNPDFGFLRDQGADSKSRRKLESIVMAAVRKAFSPEFINRIDALLTYEPLSAPALDAILNQQLADFQRHVNSRLGTRSFRIEVSSQAREFLLARGTSAQYGARELKRVLHTHLTQPVAALLTTGAVEAGALLKVGLAEDGESLWITPAKPKKPMSLAATAA